MDFTDNVHISTEVGPCRELLKLSVQITMLYREKRDVKQHVSHAYVRRKIKSNYIHRILLTFNKFPAYFDQSVLPLGRILRMAKWFFQGYKTQSKKGKVCTHSPHKIQKLCTPFIKIMCSVSYPFYLFFEIKCSQNNYNFDYFFKVLMYT